MAGKADTQRGRMIDAFVGRLATRPFNEVELADVAADAGVTLADLRREFDGRHALLKAFVQRIDTAVLAGDDPAMADQPPRDRVFDVLMRRLDVLAPHKEAVRSLLRSVRGDPGTALFVNGLVTRSMSYMLAAARVSTGGRRGALKAQGLAFAWARIVDVWIDDPDPGLARTMVEVDRALSRGERALDMVDRLCSGLSRLDEGLSRFRGRRRGDRPAEGVAGEGI
ncbi:TetR/AcrR family transcriptional regulator [Chthonobacter albigriseus]|uniref:TetR/AcrR family transcriptional regulator n=1 Tax=Chthonobacter albigriseus TaxID=1683161 RepID=UPI0015EEDB72|nr:TetR/AcrR family transcriptional regulator [Chthonobacter albigriseus]